MYKLKHTMHYYAVAKGREVGIYQTWLQCEPQVKGFSGVIFRKFKTNDEAKNFIAQSQLVPAIVPNSACIEAQQEKDAEVMTGLKMVKKQLVESPDFIPLETENINIKMELKKEVKDEDSTDSQLWFKDVSGDFELNKINTQIQTLPTLEENPDEKESLVKSKKRKANEDMAAKPAAKRIKIGGYTFEMDEEGYVNVYLGGDYKNVSNWNCMAGYGVYFDVHHPLNASQPTTGRITHNIADIEAAIHAITAAKEIGIQKLCLNTKSVFLMRAVGWLVLWKRNGWRTKAGRVVQNRKELQKLDSLLADDNMHIKWKMNGRGGAIEQMQEANNLAQHGTEEYLELHPTKDEYYELIHSPDIHSETK